MRVHGGVFVCLRACVGVCIRPGTQTTTNLNAIIQDRFYYMKALRLQLVYAEMSSAGYTFSK